MSEEKSITEYSFEDLNINDDLFPNGCNTLFQQCFHTDHSSKLD